MTTLTREGMVKYIMNYHVHSGAFDCKYNCQEVKAKLTALPIGELYKRYSYARDADE